MTLVSSHRSYNRFTYINGEAEAVAGAGDSKGLFMLREHILHSMNYLKASENRGTAKLTLTTFRKPLKFILCSSSWKPRPTEQT